MKEFLSLGFKVYTIRFIFWPRNHPLSVLKLITDQIILIESMVLQLLFERLALIVGNQADHHANFYQELKVSHKEGQDMGLLNQQALAQSPGESPNFRGQYSYNYQKLHSYFFNKIKKDLKIMKKQSVKKWIKAFFPGNQKNPNSAQYVQYELPRALQSKQWTEAQAEIINHLINMDSIIKISQHLNQYQYATLFTINQILCQQNINLNQARKSLIGGLHTTTLQNDIKYTTKQLPYQYYSVRSLLWKICIGYLTPMCKQKWVSFMQKNLAMYKRYICQYIVQPIQKKLGVSTNNNLSPDPKRQQKIDEKIKDHPLNFSQQSKWSNYFKDVELWNMIQKDIKRTRKSCKFFQQFHDVQLENDQIVLKPQQITFSQIRKQTYADSLTRVIFIYLKNHPMQCYFQGMNQIVALIYYCFTNKNSQYFRRVSQSDTYFVFQSIMSRLPKKHYQKGEQYVKDFLNLIKKLDLRLYEELDKNKGLDMMKMTTMRWFISGFLTQFSIDQCLIIWDIFIAWPGENTMFTDCFYYMGLALIHLNRQKIIDKQNIALIFGKINHSSMEVVEKTQNLYKIFPKLLEK